MGTTRRCDPVRPLWAHRTSGRCLYGCAGRRRMIVCQDDLRLRPTIRLLQDGDSQDAREFTLPLMEFGAFCSALQNSVRR
jgi:hypothetical protein